MSETKGPVQNLGEMYVESLADIESAEKSVVLSEQCEHLRASASKAQRVLERVTLFGAATDVLLVAIVKHLEVPGVLSDGSNNVVMLEQLKVLKETSKGFLALHAEESEFCANFAQLDRTRILQQAGVDPADPVAVAAFVGKVLRAVSLTSGNPLS